MSSTDCNSRLLFKLWIILSPPIIARLIYSQMAAHLMLLIFLKLLLETVMYLLSLISKPRFQFLSTSSYIYLPWILPAYVSHKIKITRVLRFSFCNSDIDFHFIVHQLDCIFYLSIKFFIVSGGPTIQRL